MRIVRSLLMLPILVGGSSCLFLVLLVLHPCWWKIRGLSWHLPGEPVVPLPDPSPQLGKKPVTSVSKSSQQIADNPGPKVVRKKRAVTPHEISSSSFSFHSAVLVPDPAPDPSAVHFMPMRFCSHLGRKGWCAYGDACSFAHCSDELHPLAAQQD